MNKIRYLLIVLLATTCLSVPSYAQKKELLFKCSNRLDNPYGMCCHFTFTDKKADNTTLNEQAKMLRDLGCNIVRSDLTHYMVNNSNTAILDKTLKTLKENQLQFLGIATDQRFFGKQWSNDYNYNRLLKTLKGHYINNLNYLEFQNEVNFSKIPSLGNHYVDDLKQLYTLRKKNSKLKVLFSGIADNNSDFLDSAMANQAYKYFDIMNFHTYKVPEDIPSTMKRIRDNMDKYHWNKPIWLTECGMHTAKSDLSQTNHDFFVKVVPLALKKIGIDREGLKIGVIDDDEHSYYSLNSDEEKVYITDLGYSPKHLTLQQIKDVSFRDVPVIIFAQTETFYGEYFSAVLEYVRKGGTIILPFGTPFYYDASKGKQMVGKTFANRLHIGQLYYWDEEAKKLSAPEHPTFYSANKDFGTDYSFYKVGDNMTPRYLTDDLLKGKDKMTPITYAGNEKYKGVVAALYQLNSDLKGNIIIQTRMGIQKLFDKESEQARRVARIHLIAFAYGVDKVFWYKFRSNEIDPYYSEDNFGIVHADLSPKPAYYAYRTLFQMLPNGSTRPILTIKNGIYKAEWKRPDGKRVNAYWCKDGFTHQQVDSTNYRFYDYMGNVVTPHNGQINVSTGSVFAIEKER